MRRRIVARSDAGISLVELLVVMILMGVLSTLVVSVVMWATRATTSEVRNSDLWSNMQDASTQLVRDVNDASTITAATPNTLTALVVRNNLCQERAWVADTTALRLVVTTKFYAQADCTGPSSTKVTRFIGNNAVGTDTVGTNPSRYLATSTFVFYGSTDAAALADPVDPDRVSRVEWTLLAQADTGYRQQTLMSGAAFTGRGEVKTGAGPIEVASKPTLCLALRTGSDACPASVLVPSVTLLDTGKVEGRDAPVLAWQDASPTLTLGWSVYRIANPDGTLAGSGTTWKQVGYIPDPARTWWADTAAYSTDPLPAGDTAQYIVAAVTAAGVGPTSNQVKTGLRPAAPTVTATGALTSIAVTWPAVTGATGFDVYRDGLLADRITNAGTLTWTDKYGTDTPTQDLWAAAVPATDTGYGHSHNYRVVATNKWEDHLTSGIDFSTTIDENVNRLPLAANITTATYTGGVRLASPVTAAAGAFTAPAAPTITATPNTNWSNTVTLTKYAAWVGTGPTSKASVARDRGWVTQQATLTGTFGALWAETTAASQVQASRPAGATTRYQAQTCNAIGCSPWSTAATALQRPPTPASCTPSAITTRSMTVTVNPAPEEAAYTGYNLVGGTGSPTGTGTSASNTFWVDQLTHATLDTFTAKTQNASPAGSGWSEPTTCQGTTLTLGVAITAASSSTRSINATMATGNGNSSSFTLENVRTDNNVTTDSWDPLTDGTGFTLTARNSDGYNNVVTQLAVATQLLTAVAPTCSISGGGTAPTGTVTINASGGSSGGYEYSPSHYRTGLGAGTWTDGSARAANSDGYNTSWSGWSACSGSVTVAPDPYPSAWGTPAGCPSPAIYVTDTSTNTWQVRRTSSTGCALRWVVTASGATFDIPQGTVVGTGVTTIGSGATAYTQTSGDSSTPMGPLLWP
jgi:type II secretory pathway pseudopilin PulG